LLFNRVKRLWTYRLWKKDTKTIIKDKDVRINEENVIEEIIDFPILSNKDAGKRDLEVKSTNVDKMLKEMPFIDNESTEMNSENNVLINLLELLTTQIREAQEAQNSLYWNTGTLQKGIPWKESYSELSTENSTSLKQAMNS